VLYWWQGGEERGTVNEYAIYKEQWEQRAEQEYEYGLALAVETRTLARRLAELLAREFGATRVYLHGSLAREGRFHPGSDIDLAAQGIPPSEFFRAGAALTRAAGYGYHVDLVDLDIVREGMRTLILEEGILLYDRTRDPPPHS
jgi:predicted nucleotidyltransferase